MEKGKAISERAASVLREYERKTGLKTFCSEHSVAAIVEDIAKECLDLEVIDSPWLEEGVLGEFDLEEKTISIQPGLAPGLRAFTIAHDLGHAALGHAPRIVDWDEHVDERVTSRELQVQDGVYQAYNARDFMEIQANLFAAELLAPSEILRMTTREDPSWTVSGLAGRFEVSETAMLTQLTNALLLRSSMAEAEEDQDSLESSETIREETPPVLDRSQEAAVATSIPALVIAGPGAGKTRVLAERYAHLVRSGISPESVLALTFSNKAAEEMRHRVSAIVGENGEGIRAFTFHAFCLEALKSYGYLVGLPEKFDLLTEMDATLLVKRKLCELELSQLEELSDPGLYVPAVLDAISSAKNELRTPEEFEELAREWAASADSDEKWEAADKALEAARIYSEYQGWLSESKRVDYGDLISLVIQILEHSGAGKEIRSRYEHVLVDEFQDINFASGRLVKALDGGRGVVWAVADPDQSIYRFRGASAANLDRFGSDYPDFNLIRLDRNYRSEPDIVGACHGLRGTVGSAGEKAATPPLEAVRPASKSPAISLAIVPDKDAELDYLADQISLRVKRGIPLRDQAVLTTSNNQARRVVDRLTAAGLKAEGPASLLGSGEIKDTLAILALLRGGGDAGAALFRVAGAEDNPLPESEALLLLEWAQEQELPVKEALVRTDEVEGLSTAAIGFLENLSCTLDSLPAWSGAWQAILAYAFHPEGRLRTLFHDDSDEAGQRLSQVGQLAMLARSFSDREDLVEKEGLGGFIEYVQELAASNKGEGVLSLPTGGDAVRVMTVHKSKGLEFPVVYVPHLAKNHFPVRGGGPKIQLPPDFEHDNNTGSKEEDDRCLFYVALTRAEDELVMSRAEAYGSQTPEALPLIERLVREKDGRTMITEGPWKPQPKVVDSPALADRVPLISGQSESNAYSFWQIQSYDRCPLQAAYSLLSGLPEKRSAYQDFRNSVYRVLGDMRLEALESGENPSSEWAMSRLKEVWNEEGPYGHFYEPAYWRHAEQIVEVWRSSGAPFMWQVRERLSLPLADGKSIEILADAITQNPDGKIVIAHHRFGRPRKSHKQRDNVDRHALFVAAAKETWPDKSIEVVLHYLSRDKTINATPREDVVTRRIAKLKDYAQKMADSSFPPNPGHECKSCNWNLVCPSSA